MHYSIHSILRSAVLLLLVGVLFLGCNEAPTAPLPEDIGIQAQDANAGDLGAASKHPTPVTEWHVATSFLCSLVPSECPNIAQAANGHTIEILQDDGDGARWGGGTLSVHPKSVSGSGTFVHKDADEMVVAEGTWTATELLSFKDWGQSPVFCESVPFLCPAHAGRALIRIHLVAVSGAEFDGILRVTCLVPGINLPSSYKEGATLSVEGGPHFNKLVEGKGITVFAE